MMASRLELCAQVQVVNFTVTIGGLEQQLLGRVVQKERYELEEQRQKLVEEVNSNQKLLKVLEDDLLFRLASSTGNLLDDVELIEVLQKTKQTGIEVGEKLDLRQDDGPAPLLVRRQRMDARQGRRVWPRALWRGRRRQR